MAKPWRQQPTPSPLSVGVWTGNTDDGYSVFRNGAYYSQPNSLLGPTPGMATLSLDFGFGQSLSLDFGGFHAVAPPAPPAPEP